DPAEDLVGRARALDGAEQSGTPVVLEDRRGLARVHVEPAADGLLAIVLALRERPAAAIAVPAPFGRLEAHVRERAAALAHAPAGDPLHQLVARHVDRHHG